MSIDQGVCAGNNIDWPAAITMGSFAIYCILFIIEFNGGKSMQKTPKLSLLVDAGSSHFLTWGLFTLCFYPMFTVYVGKTHDLNTKCVHRVTLVRQRPKEYVKT